MDLLVTGGTGILGRRVVERLTRRGHAVRVLTRQASPDLPAGVVTVRGDMTTGEGLDRAAHDAEAIVHCASATGSLRGRPDDVDGTRRLIHAARATGAPHLVFISIVGIDDHPMPYYRMKRETETVVEHGDLPWTILRATQFHRFVARILAGLSRLPIVPVPKDTAVQPVSVEEVADRMVAAALGDPAGRLPDVGGPQVLGFDHLARTYLDATGERRRVVAVPIPGRTARAFREGRHLCPDRAVGTVTWERFLAETR